MAFGIRKEGNRGGKTIQKSGNEKINIKPLDRVITEEKKACFIKIDVEGHEKEVILGSKKFLSNNSCLIQVEVLNESKFKSFDLMMSELGFKLIKKIEDYYYTNFN